MRLIEFEYTDNIWTLQPIRFNQSNLLVGANSTGKSRTIEAIKSCADFISQSGASHHFFNITDTINCKMKFKDGDTHIVYSFISEEKKIIEERLFLISDNKEEFIVLRDSISSSLNGQKVTPPVDKLLINVRRDEEQYPIFEKIIHWAENTYYIPFSLLKDRTMFEIADNKNNLSDYLLSFTQEQKERVIQKVKTLNYHITNVNVRKFGEFKLPFITEEKVETKLPILSLSTGMVCVIYILVILEYLSAHNMPSCILIDDFCEGLDYERSKQLGKLIFDYSYEQGTDLIVSSNDSFLMDVVPTDKWIILTREGSVVGNLSQQTHPDLFEDFSFTGLNNFTLFSSNYIEKYLARNQSKDGQSV